MIFDTDVMIWAFRGNGKALDAIDEATARSISSITYMELLQGVRNKAEMLSMKRFLMPSQTHSPSGNYSIHDS